jgi:hypothetical protein
VRRRAARAIGARLAGEDREPVALPTTEYRRRGTGKAGIL